MARDGANDREGIALWAGRRLNHDRDDGGDVATVTNVILLRGPAVYRARGFISIAAEVFNEVTDRLATLGDDVYLVGQVHGHPPYASTDLSYTDVTYGIRISEYLSVVAPDFGMRPHGRLADCGVHVFESAAGWRRMEQREVHRRIAVPESPALRDAVITVADEAGGEARDD